MGVMKSVEIAQAELQNIGLAPERCLQDTEQEPSLYPPLQCKMLSYVPSQHAIELLGVESYLATARKSSLLHVILGSLKAQQSHDGRDGLDG